MTNETAQPAPETDEKKSRDLGSYVVWAFVVVMLYFLSSGPMFLLTTEGGRPIRAFRSPMCAKMFCGFYWPLIRAWDTKGPLHKAVGIYWHLWIPTMFTANGDRAWHRLP